MTEDPSPVCNSSVTEGRATDGTPLFFPFGFSVTLPAVLVPHAALGVGEGVLTVLVYRLVGRIKGRAGP